MKRSGSAKFPNSVELFKFCQKVLSDVRQTKVNDQEVGEILEFNPSDCSHWKRGEKNVRSVFALAKLAEVLKVEETLLHDVASSAIGLDEAYFEYQEANIISDTMKKAREILGASILEVNDRVEKFISQLHSQCEFSNPPLYLPEVLRFFSFVTTQPVEMVEKLSRILRLKPGKYIINFRKGDLRPQTRMSMARDLAKIIFEAERARFPELGQCNDPAILAYEELLFVANLMAPKNLLVDEMAKTDPRKNMVAELAALFWVPKTLIGLQLQELIKATPAMVDRGVKSERATNLQDRWPTATAS